MLSAARRRLGGSVTDGTSRGSVVGDLTLKTSDSSSLQYFLPPACAGSVIF